MPYPENTERNREIYKLWSLRHWTQERIAEKYDIGQQRVSEIIAAEQAKIPALDASEMRRRSVELLQYVHDEAVALAEMEAAPVAVGKDGSIFYDENGKVVRDYALRLNALGLAMKAGNDIAKRLGLDAPTRAEVSGSIRYEIGEDAGL